MSAHPSWGRYPAAPPAHAVPLHDRSELPALDRMAGPLLAYGLGRSYGDACLNDGGTLLLTRGLSRFMAFDETTGILRCEAGTSLAEILETFLPRGWTLPVTPGTKYVTVGGAIANDVHGKNHHAAGTFGDHVPRFELLRSDGTRTTCSATECPALYEATIGGLGLTGLITWAEVRLRKVASPLVDTEEIRMRGLDEFFALTAESDRDYEFTVSWIDCLAAGRKLGRGIFMRGNQATAAPPPAALRAARGGPRLSVPLDAPAGLLNRLTVGLFNAVYYRKSLKGRVHKTVGPDPFFYPLDGIGRWNRLYGKHGFFQYQCVVPMADGARAMREILRRIAKSGQASFLAVLKVFGERRSPGWMSFPRGGVTLALDLPNRGAGTLRLLDDLDAITSDAGGALYPAKDARMSPEQFRRSFPRLDEFRAMVDPAFSSTFWRRVTA